MSTERLEDSASIDFEEDPIAFHFDRATNPNYNFSEAKREVHARFLFNVKEIVGPVRYQRIIDEQMGKLLNQ